MANELSAKKLNDPLRSLKTRTKDKGSVCDREISIGDYVLSGGELPATVIVDAESWSGFPEYLTTKRPRYRTACRRPAGCSGPARPADWNGRRGARCSCGHEAKINEWTCVTEAWWSRDRRGDDVTPCCSSPTLFPGTPPCYNPWQQSFPRAG